MNNSKLMIGILLVSAQLSYGQTKEFTLEEAKSISKNIRLMETIKKWESEEHLEIQEKIANFQIDPVIPKTVTDVDIARVYIDSIYSSQPVANFFGGNILEPIFNWLYFPIERSSSIIFRMKLVGILEVFSGLDSIIILLKKLYQNYIMHRFILFF